VSDVNIAVIALLAIGLMQSPSLVSYAVSFPNRAHHEAEILATFPNLPAGPVELWMSRSSPGRYAVHEFAKNVYNLRAEDGRGRPLAATPSTPYSWKVSGHNGTVRVRYTLYGDRGDGTYTQIDRSHVHLNIPAAFLWARGLDQRPIQVIFKELPPGWRVATQLKPTTNPFVFTAPGLQFFMDSPTTLGPIDIRTWLVSNGQRVDTMRLAIDHLGTAEEVDRYVEMIKKIVAEEAGVFGELAPFDWGIYTFLADYLPWASGDGMEHRNSTSLTETQPLSSGMVDHLGTVAHEFFHSWNVERIRPKTLEPFDFTQANMSGELWLAEGFTSYYGSLSMRRAGFSTDEGLARSLGGAVNAVINSPGRKFFSAVDMSRQAPFVDAAQSIDPQNRVNTFISYYTFGEAIAAGLDLTLRSRFSGMSLDDFMRRMWVKFGKTERPYTLEDVPTTLGEVTGDPAFANDYVHRYITGREVPDYTALFATVGFLFRPVRPDAVWLGDVTFSATAKGVTVASAVLIGQPLYGAGVERGDLITMLDGHAIRSAAGIDSVLALHIAGDTLELRFESRGVLASGRAVLTHDSSMELVLMETAGATPSPEALTARRRWLASKAGIAGAPR
jgi:predicted metalloprotease with PDZ domain